MIRVVLDANVFVSGLISNGGPPHKILNAWLDGKYQLFISPMILSELERVIYYPRIKARLTIEIIADIFEKLKAFAKITDGMLELDLLQRDPSDNVYLACAVEAKADYLVTGNLAHFEEARNSCRGVKIVSPREFLNHLNIED